MMGPRRARAEGDFEAVSMAQERASRRAVRAAVWWVVVVVVVGEWV